MTQRIETAIEGTQPDPPPADGEAGPSGARATRQRRCAQCPDGAWAAQAILDAIPGIGLRVAETILAELGTDMSRFPTRGM